MKHLVTFDIDFYQQTSKCSNSDKFSFLSSPTPLPASPSLPNSGMHWMKIMRSLFPRTQERKLTEAQIVFDLARELFSLYHCDADGSLIHGNDLQPRAVKMEEDGGEGGLVKCSVE